jgi:manganese efflux pump family protein
VVALLLVAVALGLSNFAASVGIGLSGAGRGARLRVGVVFGLFETAMPVAGLLLGHGLAGSLGGAARWVGGGLLIVCGVYAVFSALRGGGRDAGARPAAAMGAMGTGRLLVTGAALSLDNLAVGFALSTYHVGLVVAVVVIGAVSVALSLAGLELGGRLGAVAGSRSEIIGGLVLIGVGAALAAGAL